MYVNKPRIKKKSVSDSTNGKGKITETSLRKIKIGIRIAIIAHEKNYDSGNFQH